MGKTIKDNAQIIMITADGQRFENGENPKLDLSSIPEHERVDWFKFMRKRILEIREDPEQYAILMQGAERAKARMATAQAK